ncbi:hypothetical protein SK128_020653 [Halocaridina rubra]|uniref:C2H2-type domain-containing protein n=1 Tax=Halocaridina rubra TaxID=373956 RepID=A0AAN8XD61_HALRR
MVSKKKDYCKSAKKQQSLLCYSESPNTGPTGSLMSTCKLSHLQWLHGDQGSFNDTKLEVKQHKLESIYADWFTDSENDGEENESDMTVGCSIESDDGDNKGNIFLCHMCGYKCLDIIGFKEHIKEHNENKVADVFSCHCVYCSRCFSSSEDLENHLTHHKGPCEICGAVFKCNGLFGNHFDTMHSNNKVTEIYKHTCVHYGSIFAESEDLASHIHRLKIPCKMCGTSFDCNALFLGRREEINNSLIENFDEVCEDSKEMNLCWETLHESGRQQSATCSNEVLMQSDVAVRRVHSSTSLNQYACEECDFTGSQKSLPIHREELLRKKYGLPLQGYSSEEDNRFWEEVKEKTCRVREKPNSKRTSKSKLKSKKKRKSYEKLLLEDSKDELGYISYKEEADNDILPTVCKGNETVQDIKTNLKVKDENKCADICKDQEWITDDEVDEEIAIDLTVAFKDEFKRKRVPAHTHAKNFVCKACNKKYSKNIYLREHIVRDHKDHEVAKEYKFICNYCNRVYNNQKRLDHHHSLHCGPCEICGMMFDCNALFWVHRKTHDAVCDVCDKVFLSTGALATHKKMKHMKLKFFCDICEKGFAYQSMLKAHSKKAHSLMSEDTQYSSKESVSRTSQDLNCKECAYSAKNFQSLRVHEGMAHKKKERKGDKVHTCHICNAELSTRAILRKHLKRHVGSAKYECELCHKLCLTEKSVLSHMKKAHGEISYTEGGERFPLIVEGQQVYQCKSCPYVYDTHIALQNHILSEHNSIPKNIHITIDQDHCVYKCELCDAVFNVAEMLHDHKLSFHNFEPESCAEEIIQVTTADHLNIHDSVGDFQIVRVSPTHNNPLNTILQEPRLETLDISMEQTTNASDTRTTLSLPSYAVPSNVNLVEIDGIQYHVIRGGE